MLNLMENSYNTNISRENPFDNLDFFSGVKENKFLKTTKNSPWQTAFLVWCKNSMQFQFVKWHAKQLCQCWKKVTLKVERRRVQIKRRDEGYYFVYIYSSAVPRWFCRLLCAIYDRLSAKVGWFACKAWKSSTFQLACKSYLNHLFTSFFTGLRAVVF